MKRKSADPKKTAVFRKPVARSRETRATGATIPAAPHESAFREIIELIHQARQRAFQAVNTELIDLYWQVGEHISRKIVADGWGKNTVVALADFIRRHEPGVRGFSSQNLWRMRQFYETYRQEPKLSPLVRDLSWTHNLLILSGCKRLDAREFYLRLAVRERWGKRELERQINGCLFERAVLNPPKVSALLRELHPKAETVFKMNKPLFCVPSVFALRSLIYASQPKLAPPMLEMESCT